MARLSSTYWDWNPNLPAAFAAQKADYLFGGGLIVVAFVLQLASFFAPNDPMLSTSTAKTLPWIAVAATLGGFVMLRLGAGQLARHYEAQITAQLKRDLEESKK